MEQSQRSEPGGELEVAIEKLVYGGDGLARWNGQVLLTPFVLPGETARVEVLESKPGLLRGRLIELASASAERVTPECQHFGVCGGCHYQHARYEYQLAAKQGIVRETLRRVGKLEPPERIDVVAGPPYCYRNRAQLHILDRQVGYLEAGSHSLVPIRECPISSPRLIESILTLQDMAHDPRFPEFVRGVELFTNETETQLNVLESARPPARRLFDWAAERIPGAAEGSLDYAAAGEVYRVSYGSFFQVNRFLLDGLVAAALEGAEGERALDLYAGVGLFTIPLARRFRLVTAVESSTSASHDLSFNAERANVSVAAIRGAAEVFLEQLERAPDFVLADPPRAGLGKQVVRHLLRLSPPRLTVVSCDPATLARDLASLVAGGYRLEGLTMVDLFPQTYHIESIARLVRDAAPAVQ
jgi:23S rRNA (uracil1939-C5)-methyltransferase